MKDFKEVFEAAGFNLNGMQYFQDCGDQPQAYNAARQIFNQRFQFRPWAIVYPKTAEDVSQLVRFAAQEDRELKVRGGGHDHEGECSATDALALDMRHMADAKVDKERGVAVIQPGGVFANLIKVLNEAKVGIPHGTCQSVGITGFTLGGGWGPWTRKQGMCCESLVEATIVLGDGTIKKLTENCEDKELLWALRGGGGFSYGIVTELVIKTFPLPEVTHKFDLTWTTQPAIKVLEGWEKAIEPDNSPNLLGTNLQIFAKPEDAQSLDNSVHECHFFGYYAGNEEEINKMIEVWFPELPPDHIFIYPEVPDSHLQFTSWERVPMKRRQLMRGGRPLLGDIPLEKDGPAPHKITSRLVNPEGLGVEGRRKLINSLRSSLLFPQGSELGVLAYCTLGAISGSFYRDYNPWEHRLGSAFPYKDRPYTIQYQVWWDTHEVDFPTNQALQDAQLEREGVNMYTNRAMDWIEDTRKADFPQTSGAFISFKDAGIPTKTYFMQHYDRLVQAKKEYSRDPDNRFRSRKTIV